MPKNINKQTKIFNTENSYHTYKHTHTYTLTHIHILFDMFSYKRNIHIQSNDNVIATATSESVCSSKVVECVSHDDCDDNNNIHLALF